MDDGDAAFLVRPEVQAEIKVAILNITTLLPDLVAAVSKQDPNQHVLDGVDALPSAAREVTAGRRRDPPVSSHHETQDEEL